MKSTQNLAIIESELTKLFLSSPFIPRVVKRIDEASGRAYLVGGAVRDFVLGQTVYDIDIEVHGLTLELLSDILSQEGPVSYVGKSFGVLKLHGTLTDWALPRSDKPGRKPEVIINPELGIEDALRRRDLTMNAMAIDLLTGEFIDPFNGFADMQERILRSPDIDFFCEDPLRFYRVMQFVGRFEMYPDTILFQRCTKMVIHNVSVERIEGEFEKLLLKSKRPSLGLRWLHDLGRLPEILPELAQAKNIVQDEEWHPEGTVFEHLMQTLDAAARIDKGTDPLNLVLRYAALCHDLGKISTTEELDSHSISYGHAEAGISYAQALLKRITRNIKLIDSVSILVKHHMEPGQFVQQNSPLAAYRRLALRLAPESNLDMLLSLSIADRRGRNPDGHEPLTIVPTFVEVFFERAQEAQALHEPEKPLLKGRDILDIVQPGSQMGVLLKYAYEMQIEKSVKDKELLKEYIKECLKKESAQ
jgi:tRNA nucleotidyltransferase (CCA-adding enzyme)